MIIFLTISGAVIAVASAYIQWIKEEASTHKNKTLIFTTVGVLAAACGAIWQSIDSDKLEKSLITSDSTIIGLQKRNLNLQSEINNFITSGDAKPCLYITKLAKMFNEKLKVNYIVIYFEIKNVGKYPLQNTICKIHDNWSPQMIANDMGYYINSMGGFGNIPSPEQEANKSYPLKIFDIGTLTSQRNYQLYAATFSPAILNGTKPNYSVEIVWNNGRLQYFLFFEITKEYKLKIESAEILLNEKMLKDYSGYLVVNP